MPTRKPKRTNWKQMYEHVSRLLRNVQVDRDHWQQKFEQSTRLWREDSEGKQDKIAALERHNAELLKEREANFAGTPAKCMTCGDHVDDSIVMVRRFCDRPECIPQIPVTTPSWLRRNWVELTVMATVLGAIGFVVWRAWH